MSHPVQLPQKFGRMVEWLNGRQHIVTDADEHHYLTPGWNAAPGAKPGDRIQLEYRATRGLGLWYGKVAP